MSEPLECVAFTGPSSLTPPQAEVVARVSAAVEARQYRSGGAPGADSVAAVACLTRHPTAVHDLVVPAYVPWNAGYLAQYFTEAQVRTAPLPPQAEPYVQAAAEAGAFLPRKVWSKVYMRRNDELVAPPTDLLVAFLLRPTYYRSGEWATVRRAEAAGVEVRKVCFT